MLPPPGYEIEGSRKIFLTFIIQETPKGLSGLMMAGLFAAGLSSLNSAINAMSSTFINDFYKRIVKDKDEKYYLKISRYMVVVFGLILGSFASYSIFWQKSHPETTLIDFALLVMVYAYSGLVAVFLTAIFTRRGNQLTVIVALVSGFLTVVYLQNFHSTHIAFPWQMLISTCVAFFICIAGKGKKEGFWG
ncbi:MAG: hypothetical protein GY710_04695 [Desulfobacteraceae bacterium]|nr:hypothetical protein [Desulfobacteraceae bacterium]